MSNLSTQNKYNVKHASKHAYIIPKGRLGQMANMISAEEVNYHYMSRPVHAFLLTFPETDWCVDDNVGHLVQSDYQ